MSDTANLWEIEQSLQNDTTILFCGVDEAGRGPLAGPVCAAAVILPFGMEIEGLNDSKKLTDKKRRSLFEIIKKEAIAYGIALVDEKRIDEINILQATFEAMREAVLQLSVKPDLVLVDGNQDPKLSLPAKTVIKGDAKSANIAAASILAKVTRDMLMEKMAEKYPQYGFEVHKGYGTKKHYESLRQYGPSEIHRMTFLRSLYGTK